MFMVITIIFIVLFLFRMASSIWESKTPGVWETLTVEEYVGMRVLEIVYILNHVYNPFVYAFMDVKFKAEIKRMCLCKI